MSELDDDALKALTKERLIKIIRKQQASETKLMEVITNFSKDMDLMRNEIEMMKKERTEKYEVGDIEKRIIELEQKGKEKFHSSSDKRIVELEKNVYAQQQYSRRESVEFVGISEDVRDEDLEKLVISIFKKVGIQVSGRDFHAVHRLHNKSTVIARLVNRKDAAKY